MIIKTDKEHLYKDQKTGALINKNISELQRYKTQKKQFNEIKKIIQRLEDVEKKLESLCNNNIEKG